MNREPMPLVNGTRIDRAVWDNNTHIKDLLWYDGPLISLFRNDKGVANIVVFVDIDDKSIRWLIFEIDEISLNRLLCGEISYLTAQRFAKVYYLVDANATEFHRAYRVERNNLPPEYELSDVKR